MTIKSPSLHLLCDTVIPLSLSFIFMYTGVSKLLSAEKFATQLSTLLHEHAIAKTTGYVLPSMEIILALILVTPKTKIPALAVSFVLLTAFTVYIIIVLAAADRPCTCGGVIASMTWTQHLFFNLSLLILNAVSIYYKKYLQIRE